MFLKQDTFETLVFLELLEQGLRSYVTGKYVTVFAILRDFKVII